MAARIFPALGRSAESRKYHIVRVFHPTTHSPFNQILRAVLKTPTFQMLNGPVLMDPVDGGGIFGAVRLRMGMISRGAANRTHEFPELGANDGLSLRVAKRMTGR